ncbi:hypothetical protein [Phytohalomonas tamaricis]|nr:hypothetical protein [Phytohalomonas tamaricis]
MRRRTAGLLIALMIGGFIGSVWLYAAWAGCELTESDALYCPLLTEDWGD